LSSNSTARRASTADRSRANRAASASAVGDEAAVRGTLQRYWSLLEEGSYERAFSLIAPGRQVRSNWLSEQRADDLTNASISIGDVSASGSSATAQITNLRTDASSGCFDWQGRYEMVEIGGDWLIDKAKISKSPC